MCKLHLSPKKAQHWDRQLLQKTFSHKVLGQILCQRNRCDARIRFLCDDSLYTTKYLQVTLDQSLAICSYKDALC
jgi:hypothetical protein